MGLEELGRGRIREEIGLVLKFLMLPVSVTVLAYWFCESVRLVTWNQVVRT